jgi:hypothetical protein
MPTGFEDEPTVVDGSHEAELIAAPEPPALPFTLTREKPSNDDGWLLTLPPEKRAILERATRPARDWPLASRLPGAVATPARKIPSL